MRIKKVIFGVVILSILLLAGLTSCPKGGLPSVNTEGGDVTVTFVTNGGSALDSITVESGATIARPNTTMVPSGAKTRFRGWYTDGAAYEDIDAMSAEEKEIFWREKGFKKIFEFSSERIFKSITLYADWGYREGDTGQSGGKIFYRDDAGFTMAHNNSTAYYLEVAPQGEGRQWFVGPREVANIPPGTGYSDTIGGGMKSTLWVISMRPTARAANACRNARYGDLDDWYLPSTVEIDKLYQYVDSVKKAGKPDELNIIPAATPYFYWTSITYDNQYVWACNFRNGGTDTRQNDELHVRAIRAF